MPPKPAWDHAQRSSESELNSIVQSRVLKQWKRTKRSIQAPTFHLISHLSKWTPKDGTRTERTWYLIWKAADWCLLKVGHLAAGRSPFRCKLFWNKFKVNSGRVPFDQKSRFEFPKFLYVEWNSVFHQAEPIVFYSRLSTFPTKNYLRKCCGIMMKWLS